MRNSVKKVFFSLALFICTQLHASRTNIVILTINAVEARMAANEALENSPNSPETQKLLDEALTSAQAFEKGTEEELKNATQEHQSNLQILLSSAKKMVNDVQELLQQANTPKDKD